MPLELLLSTSHWQKVSWWLLQIMAMLLHVRWLHDLLYLGGQEATAARSVHHAGYYRSSKEQLWVGLFFPL